MRRRIPPYSQTAYRAVKEKALRISGPNELSQLLDQIGDARIVLLGEASHGTHEYYTWRSAISRKLIEEKGFSFIAVEGDWPDCYRLNRYIKSYPDSGISARDVLGAMQRWPTWMWANWEIVQLSEWLKNHNMSFPAEKRVGFYGLDVYSLWESLEAIEHYLCKSYPSALPVLREVQLCFEPYYDNEVAYARATSRFSSSCERDVLELLEKLRKTQQNYAGDGEAGFDAEQNAVVAVNAEKYYRAMLHGGPASWNVRDTHMTETLRRLLAFHGEGTRAVIWAHNTHIGDARATDMALDNTINIGQLITEEFGNEVVKVGFGSYKGAVVAGREWNDVMRVMQVPPAPEGSWEELLHSAGQGSNLFLTKEALKSEVFHETVGHRAIGVVYHPEYERPGNYVPSVIADRYDAFIYIDETRALHPLHIKPHGGKIPETYPWGM